MTLADKLKSHGVTAPPTKRRAAPLWEGPSGSGPNGGITFSLLSRFLCCRERFRLYVVEGLKAQEGFNHRLEYGNMWHVCEEALAGGGSWETPLTAYARDLLKKYPTQGKEVQHWYEVCRVQFPTYIKYWSQHPDVERRVPLLQEKVFDVAYRLPSGRTVRLRGKWDSVDQVAAGPNKGVWLQENKTKGDVDQQALTRQLTFDLQTMLYLTAINYYDWTEGQGPLKGRFNVFSNLPLPPRGVRYNVIRRPLSGGKGTIRQHKPTKSNPRGESTAAYYERLRGLIEEEPETYFLRWNVDVSPQDVTVFRRQCLDPILEQLCDWWQWVSFITGHSSNPGQVWDNDVSFGGRPDLDGNGNHTSAIHWRHPYGCDNYLNEGYAGDLDHYLTTGSEVGLHRAETLFTELQS